MAPLWIPQSSALTSLYNYSPLTEPFLTILPFSEDNLAQALSNPLTPADKVKARKHYRYFCEYLGSTGDSLNAKTIVIEHRYVSKSYLMDYSSYYSTCFSDYSRFCKRVHFFSKEFTKKGFNAAIKNLAATENIAIWESYLGYIVVKPLPSIPIGATLLKTYNHTDTDKRFFSSTKEYKINLFGKELSINSLAFQEQDSVVGACASSALWSAFHKTSQLFQTPLPSPSDITRSAKNLFENSGRTFPNSGLDHYQIGNAIESVGLVSELRNSNKFADTSHLKAFIYAYNKMGLPVLLGIQLESLGKHLITIVGSKKTNDLGFPRIDVKMPLLATKIERFYAHDDQIGPFSKLGFNGSGDFATSWLNDNGENVSAKLVSVFIPINNKIRITFEDIYAKVRWVDFYFLQRVATAQIYWDIYLDFSNEYKKQIRSSVAIPGHLKYSLLVEPLPKYLWIAKAFLNEECMIELLFDATQIASSDFCIKINIYNDSFRDLLKADLLNATMYNYFSDKLGKSFSELLVKSSS